MHPAAGTLIFAVTLMVAGCMSDTPMQGTRTSFRYFTNFMAFAHSESAGAVSLTSPPIEAERWDELVLSWNGKCPPRHRMVFEARAFDGSEWTRFYNMGVWTEGSSRESIKGQRDDDASVDTDTLKCKRPMTAAQVRITFTSDNVTLPQLNFLGVSFLDGEASAPANLATNKAAWGRTLAVPERSQLGHKDGSGWCSPTAVSMMLAYWSRALDRPELDIPVPAVAAGVHDPNWGGTGNWSFNMAFAGSFPGMRAYVTRLDELAQVEQCIAAGVPIALSVSFDLLNGKERDIGNGHLVVVAGFTATGDVVLNDPWPNPKGENRVRKIIPRERLLRAWNRSKQTVYIIHPESKNPLSGLPERGL